MIDIKEVRKQFLSKLPNCKYPVLLFHESTILEGGYGFSFIYLDPVNGNFYDLTPKRTQTDGFKDDVSMVIQEGGINVVTRFFSTPLKSLDGVKKIAKNYEIAFQEGRKDDTKASGYFMDRIGFKETKKKLLETLFYTYPGERKILPWSEAVEQAVKDLGIFKDALNEVDSLYEKSS
jgi:hypothetical protein